MASKIDKHPTSVNASVPIPSSKYCKRHAKTTSVVLVMAILVGFSYLNALTRLTWASRFKKPATDAQNKSNGRSAGLVSL